MANDGNFQEGHSRSNSRNSRACLLRLEAQVSYRDPRHPSSGCSSKNNSKKRGLFTGGISRIFSISTFSRISRQWSDSPLFSIVSRISKFSRVSRVMDFSEKTPFRTFSKRPLFPNPKHLEKNSRDCILPAGGGVVDCFLSTVQRGQTCIFFFKRALFKPPILRAGGGGGCCKTTSLRIKVHRLSRWLCKPYSESRIARIEGTSVFPIALQTVLGDALTMGRNGERGGGGV